MPEDKPAEEQQAPQNEIVKVKPGGCPTTASLMRTISSKELFGEARMVMIEHQGEHYRMMVTKNDKLILQK